MQNVLRTRALRRTVLTSLSCLALGAPACGASSEAEPERDPSASADGSTLDAGRDASLPDAASDGPDVNAPRDAGKDASSNTDAGKAVQASPVGPQGTWTRIFTDEFDGPTLDPMKWNAGWFTLGTSSASPPVSKEELQYYNPEAILFPGDGAVHLRLSLASGKGFGKGYQSGMIQSSNRFTFDATKTRTVLEARLRVPGPDDKAAGYWPAYWLLSNENSSGQGSTWPPEIDIFEFFGTSTEARAHLHTTGGDINRGFTASSGVDLSMDFHVYTFDMSSKELAFYLDGVSKWSFTDAAVIDRVLRPAPLYILFNLAYGGAGGDPTASTALPADMVIDYVRAWTASGGS